MEFPFQTYNPNATVNHGPALRGSGNTFWHPPMMPQSQSDPEPYWHPPLVPPTKKISTIRHSNTSRSDSSSSTSDSDSSSVRSTPPTTTTGDSVMDFLQAIQDDELFSAYLHPHDEKTVSTAENGTAMYVDSFF
jgi:hypothetical protein